MLHVIEIGAEIQINDARLLLDNPLGYSGFDSNKPMLVVCAGTPRSKVDFEQVAQRLGALPGAKHVSFSKYVPLSGSGRVSAEVSIPGRELVVGTSEPKVRYNVVGPNYFQTMGTRLLRGRVFDRGESDESAIVNETMARRFWPHQDPIGRWFGADGASRQVVGVVEDGKYDSLRESAQPFLFLPYSQGGGGETYFFIETAVEPGSLAATARREVSAAGLIVLQTVTLQGQMRLSRYFEEMGAGIVGGAGLLAVFLAAVGMFGVVASVMGLRRREFGIRIALGATRLDIMKIVYGHGLKLALVGLPMGLAAAYLGTLALRSVLYGVEPGDPLTFLGGSVLIVLITLAACHVPAVRATQVEPAATLRSE